MSKVPSYGQLWPKYAQQWDRMTINANKSGTATQIAQRLLAQKARYQIVEAKTGVPWFMIAVIHERESSQNFKTQLAQGDPLGRVSTHVPAGRGPFRTWEEGCYDALVTLKHWDKIIDWRLEKILYYLELYNGWGYYYHGVPSAYVWSWTNIYKGGKYIADGVWSSSAMDAQPGCAALMKRMAELDPSIKFVRETPMGATEPAPPAPAPAPAPAPVKKSWWQSLIGLFSRS